MIQKQKGMQKFNIEPGCDVACMQVMYNQDFALNICILVAH